MNELKNWPERIYVTEPWIAIWHIDQNRNNDRKEYIRADLAKPDGEKIVRALARIEMQRFGTANPSLCTKMARDIIQELMKGEEK